MLIDGGRGVCCVRHPDFLPTSHFAKRCLQAQGISCPCEHEMGEMSPVCGRIWVHILSTSYCPNGLIRQESRCLFQHSLSSVHVNNCTETAHGIQPFPGNPSLLMPFFSPWIVESQNVV